MPAARESFARIATNAMPWLAGEADEAVAASRGTSAPRRASSDRILVELPLPGDVLIELVSRDDGAGSALS